MTTRSAALITIGLIACLLVAVALAALYAGDISERSLSIVTSILGTLATVLAGLLLFLRVETVSSKVDTAAARAATAVERAAVVERKVDNVHEALLNGDLRDNVKQALKEAESDPSLLATRIETIAKGVQKDRHDKAQRDTIEQNRERIEELRKKREARQGS